MRAETVTTKLKLTAIAFMWTKLCTKSSKKKFVQNFIKHFMNPKKTFIFCLVNWHILSQMSFLIQHYHEQKTIHVQNVVVVKLYFSKLKQDVLKKKWDCIMFAPVKIALIVGQNKNWCFIHIFNKTIRRLNKKKEKIFPQNFLFLFNCPSLTIFFIFFYFIFKLEKDANLH
jgi:hypothetical protein